MVETMCTSGAVKWKAGANVNATVIESSIAMTQFINQAESDINATTRINYTDTYASLTDDKKKILEEVCSNLAAMYVITYDMSGFTSSFEAETMLDVLRDGAVRGLSLLRDDKTKKFINVT